MSVTSAPAPANGEAAEPRSWLRIEVDGRPVAFWLMIAVAIAALTLGFGAWWVWGLDRGMPMANDMGDEMAAMPQTDVRLPPVTGFYEGEEVFFVHPEASDPDVAGMLTEMMAGSPVLVVPQLADVPAEALDDVYVFANGVEGTGPFGFQADVFPSAPGDDGYSPLRRVVVVTWHDEQQARVLNSAEEVSAAAAGGELDLEQTDVVVNMPFLTWPDGSR